MSWLNRWGRGALICACTLVTATVSSATQAAPGGTFQLQLRQARARFDGRWLNVRLGWLGRTPKGTLTLRLLDLRGRSLATTSRVLAAGRTTPLQLRLAVPAQHRKKPDLLRLAVTFTGRAKPNIRAKDVVALSEIGDMPFVWLRGQARLTAGSRATLQVTVRDLKRRPLPGAKVHLTLKAAGRTLTRRGTADALGDLQLAFAIPRAWAGRQARLQITARTAAFTRTLRHRIQIRRTIEPLLATDKPIYQPGQTVHLRLLVLRQPSRKPLAGAKVTFSALDTRSNRLFRKTATTDSYGVAWTRVVLSRHVAVGSLTLRARVQADARHSQTAQVKVRVFRYRVPPFRLKILSDRGHYRPGTHLRATVEARYLQGKPVPGAQVKVVATLLRDARSCGSGRRYCRRITQSPLQFATVKGRTNRRGQLRLRATIPKNIAPRILRMGGGRVQLRATVTEPGGHCLVRVRTLPVSGHDVLLAALPEANTLVPGVVQRVFVIAAHPDGTAAPGRVRVDYWEVDKKRRRSILRRAHVRTDKSGVAVVSVKPTGRRLRLSLAATDRQGRKGYRTVELRPGTGRVLVQPQRNLWRAGEPLRVTVKTPGLRGRVHLDAKYRDQTVTTTTTILANGRATFTLKLPREVDGLVTLVARVRSSPQTWHRGWALTLVQATRRLHLRIRAHRKQYRPGDTARLDLRVTDEQGRGQRVALGLTVVDQGVYVLAGKQPGGQQNRFLLEPAARTAQTKLAGWTLERLLQTPRTAGRYRLAAAMLAKLRKGGFTAAADSLVVRGNKDFGSYRLLIKKRVSRQLKRWFKGRFRALAAGQRLQWIYHHRLHPLCPKKRPKLRSTAQLVKSGYVLLPAATDPWGQPLKWSRSYTKSDPMHFGIQLRSAGPDAAWGTVDDLKAGLYKLTIPKVRRKLCYYGYYGYSASGYSVSRYRSASPRVFMSRASVSGGLDAGAMPSWGGSRSEPRVRRNFRETLAALPGLRTDDQGRATVKLHLADNITTWVVSGIVSGLTGRLGGTVARVRTFQPFYVDMLLPQRLTRTDEVEVPVVVHNYAPHAATVTLRLKGSDWLEPVRRPTVNFRLVPGPAGPRLLRTLTTTAERTRTLIVPAQSVVSTRFRVRALRVGRGSLTVLAKAAGVADAVERTTQVVPEGLPKDQGTSGFLRGPVAHQVTLPKGFVPHSQQLRVTVEPNLLAASMSSLDSLLQRPHGCMEQSSAITYPNILALRHLRRSRAASRHKKAAIAKARAFVNEGYQRLLTFEVAGGGFSLYGSRPADVSLSALGLAQLTDLATVRYVDPRVILRTRRHLLRRQTASGSWKPEGYVDLGGGDPLTRRYVVTAYVAWLLGRSRSPNRKVVRAVARALDFLRTHLYLVRDNPYAIALAANAAAPARLRRHQSFALHLRSLLVSQARRGTTTHWRPRTGHRTVFAGNGRAATQETTALALMALHRVPRTAPLVSGAARFLLKERQPQGAWSTTRATVLSLLALLRLSSRRPQRPGKVLVYLDGRLRGELKSANGAAAHTLDLSPKLAAGTHRLRLVPVGGGAGLYRIGLRYHSRRPVVLVKGRPRIRVRYSRLRLRPGQSVRVHVRLDNPTGGRLLAPMVELGLPPGFELREPRRGLSAAHTTIDRTERRPGKLLLYFTTLPRGTTRFSFQLKARFGLRVQIPRSRFYEYYQPEQPSITRGSVIVVHRAKPRLASLLDLLR